MVLLTIDKHPVTQKNANTKRENLYFAFELNNGSESSPKHNKDMIQY